MTQAIETTAAVITDAPFHPSLAVSDLAKSRSWYADKLGWQPTMERPGLLAYELGPGAAFSLYESQFAGTAKNTVMNWIVDDVAAKVADLREKGVAFEDYDLGDMKTEDGIATDPTGGQTAWFKDLDGNIIAIISMPPETPGFEDTPAITGMIAAADLERAKAWYGDTLGFRPVFEMEGVLATYRSGDSVFAVYLTEFAGSAKNTVGVWRITGLRDEVARLRGRGVVFEDYDFGEDGRTVDGILSYPDGELNAWFRDSEGNILALAEHHG
jgi:catechol 2,3-dioxygenase-like lactoylglutathione lyase family enzyme